MLKKSFIAMALLSAAAGAHSANLLTNGSFEAGTFTGGSFGFPLAQQLTPGSTTMPGWTVVGAELAWFKTGQAGITTQDGLYALDLTGFCDLGTGCGAPGVFGAVTQTLSTVPGATYRLSFYGGTYAFNANTPSLVATAGSVTQSFALPGVGTPASGTWQQFAFNFVASSASTAITFGGSGTAVGGVIPYLGLDNVSVDLVSLPVPEPTSWALMLAGLGSLLTMARRRGAA
jgi:hypothetical protein